MKKVDRISGRAYRLPQPNVDTDMIIAAEHLKTILRTGLGASAFEKIRANPGNCFDEPAFRGATVLIAGANFGCGSSREHAVWAMADMGIEVVIAPSFGDIYYTNAIKNGFLNVALPQEQINLLLDLPLTCTVTVDLPRQMVETDQGHAFDFAIDSFAKRCMMDGLDHIGLSLQRRSDIAAFEARRNEHRPWLATIGATGEQA